ncbi:MAG: efflux RND transporter periplasmic adaptor subunit [Deltaproteobacteria bacterium]|nr:efflux RND transporter periplasmic adaptor subunit [Deltaproteobacteria bacterium]
MRVNYIKGMTFAAAVLVLSIGAGCSRDAGAPPASGAKAQGAKTISIVTAKVEGRSVERSVETTGTLVARDEVIVSNETPGIVGKISADLGDAVPVGGVLAQLDQREARLILSEAEAAVATNRARYVDAKTSFDGYGELLRQGMVSQSQYDGVKTQYDVAAAQDKDADARLALAKKRLSDTVIVSPIDGIVKKRFVSTGEAVRDRTAMFAVVSTGPLKYRGTVAEPAAPEIKTGQTMMISVDAFKERPFGATLVRISPAVDAETRTLEIEASVPNPDGVLKPGFFAKGLILTKKADNVPFVPEAAVYSFVGVTKVFVIENGVARERAVNAASRAGGLTEIAGNIKPGDAVATTNLANLYDGAAVSVEAGK